MLTTLALTTACQSTSIHPNNFSATNRTPESSQASAPSMPSGDPVGQKFEAWLAAVNSGDRAQIDTLWRGVKNAEQHASMDSEVAERTGGFEVQRIEDATETAMIARVQAKRTKRWLCLTFDVEADPPHAIQSILLRPTEAPASAEGGASTATPFDDKARKQVIEALLRELNRAYVFPEKAVAIDRDLSTRQRQHAYDAFTSRLAFGQAITEDLRRLTHDEHLHLDVGCAERATHLGRGEPTTPPSGGDRSRVFGPSRRLDGNIAYIDVATFGVPEGQARDEIRDTMSAAADAAAIIFDVRRNGGGEPEIVALLSSYLFGSEPVHLNSLYWRIPDRTDDFFTNPNVQGTKFGPTKPVYVLTSARTFSAAEEFTYDLQTRKRAVIVGETTGGGAHPGDVVALPHGFTTFVPSGRAVNPITHTNWEGTGVKPDVIVLAETALEVAHKMALAQVGTPPIVTPRDGGASSPKN
jgi:hypothetical protein